MNAGILQAVRLHPSRSRPLRRELPGKAGENGIEDGLCVLIRFRGTERVLPLRIVRRTEPDTGFRENRRRGLPEAPSHDNFVPGFAPSVRFRRGHSEIRRLRPVPAGKEHGEREELACGLRVHHGHAEKRVHPYRLVRSPILNPQAVRRKMIQAGRALPVNHNAT